MLLSLEISRTSFFVPEKPSGTSENWSLNVSRNQEASALKTPATNSETKTKYHICCSHPSPRIPLNYVAAPNFPSQLN